MNLDPEKVLVLFVIALLVLGPERLPKAARALGKGLAEIRKYTSSFQSEVNQVLAEPRAVVQSALQEMDMRSELDQFRSQVQALGQGTDGLPAEEGAELNGTPSDAVGADHDWAQEDWAAGTSPVDEGTGQEAAPGEVGAHGGLNGTGLMPSAAPDDPGLN